MKEQSFLPYRPDFDSGEGGYTQFKLSHFLFIGIIILTLHMVQLLICKQYVYKFILHQCRPYSKLTMDFSSYYGNGHDSNLALVGKLFMGLTSIARAFSTFSLVHSKLRNRPGVKNTGKIVFILYRVMSPIRYNS